MIRAVLLENFKSFGQTAAIELAPLTLLCGANSSGKSSLIQSILLVKQTLESRSPMRTVVLNSRFVRLGSFDRFVYGKDKSKSVRLGFTIEVPRTEPRGSGRRWRYPPLRMMARQLGFGLGATARAFEVPRSEAEPLLVVQAEYTLRARECAPLFGPGRADESRHYLPGVDEPSLEDVSVQRAHFSGSASSTGPGSRDRKGFEIDFQQQGDEVYKVSWSGLPTPDGNAVMIPLTFLNLFPTFSAFDQRTESVSDIMFPAMRTVHRLLEIAFGSTRYIGPLREQPSRRYLYDDEDVEIGLKGENVPYVLAVEKDRTVPDFYFRSPADDWSQISKSKLSDALQLWLRYMGISSTIVTHLRDGLGALDLPTSMTSGTMVSIADVGFGVSQILPILVEGLRLEKNETLILEQPEIHLHPLLQLRLADFLFGMAASGKRLIVETHSDHIVNRLVRRTIEDESDRFRGIARLLFFERTEDETRVRDVEISPGSGIVNWPEGFFDQTAVEQEAIIRAGILRRRGESENAQT